MSSRELLLLWSERVWCGGHKTFLSFFCVLLWRQLSPGLFPPRQFWFVHSFKVIVVSLSLLSQDAALTLCQKGQLKLRHKTTDSSLTLNAVEIYRFVVCLKLWIPGTTRQGGDHQLT